MEDLKNIERIIMRTPDESESGLFSKYNLFIFRKGQQPEIRTYEEKDLTSISEFLNQVTRQKLDANEELDEKFMITYNPQEDERKDNLVLAYLSKKIDNPNIVISNEVLNEIAKSTHHVDIDNNNDDYNYDEDDDYEIKKKKTSKLKRIAAGVGAAAIIGGSAVPIINNIVNSNDMDSEHDLNDTDYTNASIEELLSKLEEGSLAKKEYNRVANFCKNFNALATQPDNFYLDADKDNYLKISAEEALYTSVVLNNYSADELMQIFGTKTLDSNKVIESYKSFCEKIKIYNMNAKLPSGVEVLIDNPDLYFAEESSVLSYNNNSTSEMSDQVILTYKNNFENYDNIKNTNPSVVFLSTMPIRGYAEANSNSPELLKYKNSFQEETGINLGESIIDITSRIDDNDLESTIAQTVKTNVDEYNAKLATKISESKNNLLEALRNNGNDDLAAKVDARNDIRDLKDEIEKNGAEFIELFNQYQQEINAINPSSIPADALIQAIDREATPLSKCDLKLLQENRIKKQQKELIDSTKETNYNNSSNSGSSSISISNNTDSDISNDDNSDVEEENEELDQTDEAYDSVEDYVNTPGAYKYDGEIKNKYMDEAFTEEEKNQMTPLQLWEEMSKAGILLPEIETDEQLQEALKESSEYKNETFVDAWQEKIKEKIAESEKSGKTKLSDLEQEYSKTEEEVEERNNNSEVVSIEEDNTSQENNVEDNQDSYTVEYYDYDGIDDIEFDDETYSSNSNEDISYAEDGIGFASVVDDDNYIMVK